jgi:hypothetical protein
VRRSTFVAAVLAGSLTLAGPGAARAGDTTGAEPQEAQEAQLLPAKSPYLLAEIRKHRRETWHWQRLMGKPLSPTSNSAATSRRPEYRRWVLRLWKSRAAKERRIAQNPPRRAQWLCIYRHERHPRQGWATRTGNGYYGGLQMDISFQRTYGGWLLRRKGTADRWTNIEQIWVAERAYRSGRGFHPWPNTARYCGLI